MYNRIPPNVFAAISIIINIGLNWYLKLKLLSSTVFIQYTIMFYWTKKYWWLHIYVFSGILFKQEVITPY